MTPEMLDLFLPPRSGICCLHTKCGGGHMCFRSLGTVEDGYEEGFVTCMKCEVVMYGHFVVKDGRLHGKI